jgi:hypothetical protein
MATGLNLLNPVGPSTVMVWEIVQWTQESDNVVDDIDSGLRMILVDSA